MFLGSFKESNMIKPASLATLVVALVASGFGSNAAANARAEHSVKEADDVVAFWRDAGPSMWFAKNPEFDRRFRDRFAYLYRAAAKGELEHWMDSASTALALVILLDQYPRNAFRGTPQMYATDSDARRVAGLAIAMRLDHEIEPALRLFVYLPFAHSEQLVDQDRSVELVRTLGEPHLSHALHHREIIRRFGRFPHRNPILGRAMRAEEQRYLDEGGFAG
jgi:uncharacterized protein (DUF924 family)